MNDLVDTLERILTDDEKGALRETTFANRELVGLDFSGADLRGARFEKTVLTRCSLRGADLRGARFNLCNLHGVVLADAVFGDNRFDGTTIVDAVGLTPLDRSRIEEQGGTFQPGYASQR